MKYSTVNADIAEARRAVENIPPYRLADPIVKKAADEAERFLAAAERRAHVGEAAEARLCAQNAKLSAERVAVIGHFGRNRFETRMYRATAEGWWFWWVKDNGLSVESGYEANGTFAHQAIDACIARRRG